MKQIRVWAPKAREVELESGGRRIAMAKAQKGWWEVDAPFIEHGSDYAFVPDGEGPFPDPRSLWQPQGVHGASRYVNHARFKWTDSRWQPSPLASAVIYELHVGTFTPEGTFEAIIDKLGHLVNLGVTHVELMPVAEFSGVRGWGYDGVNLYAPHHAYGGPEGLKRLVDACHSQGLAVLLDVVYNHWGPVGNYLSRFGPYLTGRYVTPWGDAVNLDGPDSDEVRRYFIDNAIMWLRDYQFDGLRIDAVHAIVDTSAIHFLEQLAAEVKGLEAHVGRRLALLAESDLNDPRIIRPIEVGGYGLDAQWNEDFHHALHAVLTGERNGYYCDFGRLAEVAKVLSKGLVYDGCYSVYRRRCHGRPATGVPGSRFVGFLQNHDQVGNRALGERTSHLLSPGRLKVGAALVITAPFVPMLFQGEEWGASSPFLYFTDYQEPQIGEAVRRGHQKEFADFGWTPEEIPDPQAGETFRHSCLDWDELNREPHAGVLKWHRALIRLRRSLPALSDGRLERVRTTFDKEAKLLTVERDSVAVACNLAEKSQRALLREGWKGEILLASEEKVEADRHGILLPPESVAIVGSS